MTGTTPYPQLSDDPRLPHVAKRAHKQIAKTALGAEGGVNWQRFETLEEAIADARQRGYRVAALEQTEKSQSLPTETNENWAIILGNEADGMQPSEVELADEAWEIPMQGQKQSFNVVVAATIALWQLNQI